jgi:hypothetical protein
MKLLLIGFAIGAIVYLATSGRVIFLPLILLLPLASLFRRRKRYPLLRKRGSQWPWQEH